MIPKELDAHIKAAFQKGKREILEDMRAKKTEAPTQEVRRSHGWWLLDKPIGVPCFWPAYNWRVNLVRRFPFLYKIVWNDWR